MKFLKEGDSLRMVAETKANSKSSRSHIIFRITIETYEVNVLTQKRISKTSQINFVYLAGSEGASKNKSGGIRLFEGGNINKSLLALSNVIK